MCANCLIVIEALRVADIVYDTLTVNTQNQTMIAISIPGTVTCCQKLSKPLNVMLNTLCENLSITFSCSQINERIKQTFTVQKRTNKQ